MKTVLSLCAMGLAGALSLDGVNARADLEVSASVSIHGRADFYTPLAPYGSWIEVGSYGRCWRPARVEVGWRPYCYGQWVWTDCGWYWESDEPWAWACYHYGRWIWDPADGWIWVPDIEWAPAWVSWREGGGYIGWAPLSPRGFLFARVAAPSAFVFVGVNRFSDPIRPSTVIVNNTTIINRTTVISRLKRETRTFDGVGPRKVVINEGPGVGAVQKATGRTFQTESIREVVRRHPAPAELMHGTGQSSGASQMPDRRETPRSPAERGESPARRPEPSGQVNPRERGESPSTDRVAPPPGRPEPPAPSAHPERGEAPGKDKVAPPPGQPHGPGSAPTAPPRSPEMKGKGRGHEKGEDRGKEGKGP